MPDGMYQLSSAVSRLGDQVAALNSSVDLARVEVAVVNQKQVETKTELEQLHQQFLAFTRKQELANNKQLSKTEIGILRDRLEHEFGKHKEVREVAVGILQAFDAGMLMEEALHELASQLMLKVHGYWLAPILSILDAWAADDPGRCATAVQEAFQRSPDKTSLFLALILRRQGRHASANRWLRHYLSAQDPRALGRDFAVVLESIAQGAFGPGGLVLMREFLDRWQAQLLDNEEILAEQVKLWRTALARHVSGIAIGKFPRLAAISPQWPLMDSILRHAEAHRPILDTYRAMMAEELEPASRLEDQVDEILDRLVNDYDEPELPLRRKLQYHEAVVDHDGDAEAAQHDVDLASGALETKLDYLSVQSQSALNPELIGVSRSTQRMAVAACRDWFGEAHAGFTRDYRTQLPQRVDAVFDSGHNLGATAFKLPRWTGSFTEPMERLEHSLGEHWDRSTKPFLDSLAFNWGTKLIAPICVTLGTLLLIACSPPLGIIAFLLSAGIWSFVLYTQYQSAQENLRKHRELLAQARADSLAQLRAAGAELTDWASDFRRADAVEAEVRVMIGDLATAGHAATPYTRRGITEH